MKLPPEYELLSAYLDGEVTAPERARIEQLLAESADARRVLDELKSTSMTVQALPELRLADDLTDRILRKAEHAILSGEGQPEPAQPVSPPETHRYRRLFLRMVTSRGVAWSGAALAIALLIMLSGPRQPQRDFARAPESALEKTESAPLPAAEPRAIPEMRAFDASGKGTLDRATVDQNRTQTEPEPDGASILADSAPSMSAEPAELAEPAEPAELTEPAEPAELAQSGAPMAAMAPEQPVASAPPMPDKPAAWRRSSVGSGRAESESPPGAPAPMVSIQRDNGKLANIRSEVAPPTELDTKDADKVQPEAKPARGSMDGQAGAGGATGRAFPAAAPKSRKRDVAEELPVLLIHCDVTPEAARRQMLDQVLLDQRIATQKKGTDAEGRMHTPLPADALQAAEREETPEADAPKEEALAQDDSSQLDADQAFDVVYVEATHDQVAAALDQMAQLPDQFLAVSITPAPGVPSQQPLTRFNRRVSQVAAGRGEKAVSGPVGLSEAGEATLSERKAETADQQTQKDGEDRSKKPESMRMAGPQPETWNAAPRMAPGRQMPAGGQRLGDARLGLDANDDGRQAGPADLPVPDEPPVLGEPSAPLAQPESLEYMARPSDAPAAESRLGKESAAPAPADQSIVPSADSRYRVLFVLRVVPSDLLAAPASPPAVPADLRGESGSAPAATAPAADELPAAEPPAAEAAPAP